MGEKTQPPEEGAAHEACCSTPDASALDIDGETVSCIVSTINIFNIRCEEEALGDVEVFAGEKFSAMAFSPATLVGPLKGQTVSATVIYNNRLRGKSGAPLIFTSDFMYAIKIIRRSEFGVIKKNIYSFVNYYQSSPETLIVRYHGVYELKIGKGCSIYFVIMRNIFDGFYSRIYDLKGMQVSRACDSGLLTEKQWMNNRLRVENKERLVEQIERDTQFLQSLNLMDYSLVVGMHPVPAHPDFRMATAGREKDIRLLRSVHEYSIGIVDTLTEFDTRKLAESVYYLFCCKKNMSTVSPVNYQARFMKLIKSDCFEDDPPSPG